MVRTALTVAPTSLPRSSARLRLTSCRRPPMNRSATTFMSDMPTPIAASGRS